MRLRRIELRNFRCFESLDLDLDQTTVIVGANDTGKSTVLDAIRWLAAPWEMAADALGRRTPGDPSEEGTEAYIVGWLDELPGDIAQHLGLAAPAGVLRLARTSSRLSDLFYLTDEAGLQALCAALDLESCREYYGVDQPDEVLAMMKALGEVREVDDWVWVSTEIWEFASSGLGGLEMLDASGITAISLGRASDTRWNARSVVDAMLRQRLGAVEDRREHHWPLELTGAEQDLAAALTKIDESLDTLTAALSDAHSERLDPGSGFTEIRWHTTVRGSDLRDVIQRNLTAKVVDHGSEVALDVLGPGANRTLAIAALGLFRDPEWWGLPGSGRSQLTLLLIEEPETGLHAAAQRALARSLAQWATFGLQLVVVTHAPAFVNAAAPGGIRIARKDPDPDGGTRYRRYVVRAEGLEDVRESLGLQPADVLLCRRFVVVEGESDRLVLDAWARRMGIDLRAVGVQLVPSGGYAMAEQVARFLNLAYEGAEFMVVLDNGSDSGRTALEIEGRFGGRVHAEVLSRTEIEGYFRADALVGWLRLHGVTDDQPALERAVAEMAAVPSRRRGLGALAQRFLARPFDKVRDGLTIANLTAERDLDPEICALLTRIAAE